MHCRVYFIVNLDVRVIVDSEKRVLRTASACIATWPVSGAAATRWGMCPKFTYY